MATKLTKEEEQLRKKGRKEAEKRNKRILEEEKKREKIEKKEAKKRQRAERREECKRQREERKAVKKRARLGLVEQVDEQESTPVKTEKTEENVAPAQAEIVEREEREEGVQQLALDEPEKKPVKRNYHVSLREDGKWQVKFAKGSRALKLFDTQAEAIAFARKKAENQDGTITIHKKDGKIRRQHYAKKIDKK